MADEDGCYYTVKPDDTLDDIARRFGVRSWNCTINLPLGGSCAS